MPTHRRTPIHTTRSRKRGDKSKTVVRSQRPVNKRHQFLSKGSDVEELVDEHGNRYYSIKHSADGSDGPITIDIRQLSDISRELRSYARVPLSKLEGKPQKDFQAIKTLFGIVGFPVAYNLFGVVVEAFGDGDTETVYEPGTLGAYIMGCLNSKCDDLGLGCSPYCAGSLAPPDGTNGYEKCDKSVVIYDGESFNYTFNGPEGRNEVVIYIRKPDFKGFCQADITHLKNKGFDRAQLIFLQKDGDCTQGTGEAIGLQRLPRSEARPSNGLLNNGTDGTDGNGSTMMNGNALLVILIIILILAAIFIGWKAYNSKKEY